MPDEVNNYEQWKNEQRTIFVVPESLFKVGQVPVLVCPCDCPHAFHFSQLRVLYCKFDGQQASHVLRLQAEHLNFSFPFRRRQW